MMNKYGGINDLPFCDKRIYNLWFQMLRRCYDTTQHKRSRGKAYADCVVCERWMRLSNFAKDIVLLEGFNDWQAKTGYCLDKDIKNPGNKVYSRANCCFVPYSENIRDISRRHPNITQNANETHLTNELKPCPFCGGKARISADTEAIRDTQGRLWAFTAVCDSCCATSGLTFSPDKAAEAWNRRASE